MCLPAIPGAFSVPILPDPSVAFDTGNHPLLKMFPPWVVREPAHSGPASFHYVLPPTTPNPANVSGPQNSFPSLPFSFCTPYPSTHSANCSLHAAVPPTQTALLSTGPSWPGHLFFDGLDSTSIQSVQNWPIASWPLLPTITLVIFSHTSTCHSSGKCCVPTCLVEIAFSFDFCLTITTCIPIQGCPVGLSAWSRATSSWALP